VTTAAPSRATFSDVFAVREFRALWSSVVLSAAGDRLALVALTLLVYDRTRSPLLAAAAYAAGYLPWLIGGLFLADLADRRPRRSVMVGCDAIRAALVAAMTVPGMPVTALVVLLFAATVRVPDERRAQAFGIAGMGVIVGQGAGFVAVGTAAEVMTPAVVIAVAGGIGTVAAFALTLSWRRVAPSSAGHETGRRPARAPARLPGFRRARRGHDQAIRTCDFLTGPGS